MEQYTHTTLAQPHMKIRRERILPKNGNIAVNIGKEVKPHQVVARTPLETSFTVVDIAAELGVAPDDVPDLMVVEKNDVVDIGITLAQKKKMVRTKQVLSPAIGTLFDVINGRAVIQQTDVWLEKQAMVAGRVVSHVNDKGVIIETHGAFIQGVWGSGKEGFGVLEVLSPNSNRALTTGQLENAGKESILVVGRVENKELLEQAAEADINGLITGSMTAESCQTAQTVSFPVIITDGVGKQGMSLPIFTILKEADGQRASLFGEYEQQLGSRPEIIIPQQATIKSEAVLPNRTLQAGLIVRILRAPFTNQMGSIVKIYTLSQLTATGAKAHGCDIELADGNIVFVPSANFDVII
ncbi:MAG: hypothetical protein GY796_21440 [Chloroflexi bacterium]|nr:hypothetical protein [Chloroflexota bacterium]